MKLLIGLCMSFILFGSLWGTILIDPAGNGGFENGPTLADNGWTHVYTPPDQTNRWYLGTSPSGYTGSRCAFVSNDGTNYNYAMTSSTVYFYMDVTFPAGEGDIRLSFDYKGVGQASAAYLRVYLVSTATVLYPNSPPAVSSAIGYAYYNLTPEWTKTGITIPASNAGTSKRLAFMWKNTTTGYNPPAAIDNICLTTQAPSALSGTYHIDGTHTTGSGFYHDFVDAFLALNGSGVSAQTTFNIAADQQWLNLPPPLTATGTADATIIFQKYGTGANPILKAHGIGGTSTEGLVTITGGDYYTFDGLNLQQAGPVETAAGTYTYPLDQGYYLMAASTSNGAQHNIIKNCQINLNKLNITCKAVFQYYAYTPIAASGENAYNQYLNLEIHNVEFGVYLQGVSYTYPDVGNEISHCTFGGTTADDIGGGGQTPSAIYANYQGDLIISHNEIQHLYGTSYGPYGINLSYGTGNCKVFNNYLHDIRSTQLWIRAMYIHMAYPGPHTVSVYNNIITGIVCEYSGSNTTSYSVYGLQMLGSSATYNIDFNSIRVEGPATTYSAAIYVDNTYTNQSYDGINHIRNNILANYTAAQASSRHYGIVFEDHATLLGQAGSNSDYNVIYLDNTANGYPVRGSSTNYASLASWNSASGQDAHSYGTNPLFNSAANLHLTADSGSPALEHGSYFDGIITWVTDDFDADARPLSNPDIGADQVSSSTSLEVPVVMIELLNGNILLTWESVAGATEYRVEASSNPYSGFSTLGTTNSISWEETPNNALFYRVYAVAEEN